MHRPTFKRLTHEMASLFLRVAAILATTPQGKKVETHINGMPRPYMQGPNRLSQKGRRRRARWGGKKVKE